MRRILILPAALLVAAPAMTWAAVSNIDQVGQKFSRSSLSVHVTDHIAFLNQDDVQHNIKVIDADGAEDDKGLQKPGESIDVSFDKTGHFMVRCAIHPKMKMQVEVQ
jgi:cytochrome c peroxidase